MLEGEDMLFTEVSDIVVVDENDDVLAILDGIEEEYMEDSILVYSVGVVEDEVDVLVITVVLLLLYSCVLGEEAWTVVLVDDVVDKLLVKKVIEVGTGPEHE